MQWTGISVSTPARVTAVYAATGVGWVCAVDGIPWLYGNYRENLRYAFLMHLSFVFFSALVVMLLLQRVTWSERRLRSFTDFYPDGICSYSRHGKIIGSNPAFQRLTGFSMAELAQDRFTSQIISNDDKDKLRHLVRKALKYPNVDADNLTAEVTLVPANGRRIQTHVTVLPMVVQNFWFRQQVTGWYMIFKDVTELRQSEEKLRQLEKLTAVGELAAGVAHEIRNPLTALKGFLQMLGTTGELEDRRYVNIMKGELNRIDAIVGELLVLSKPKQSTMQETDLQELIESVIILLNAQAIMNNVEILTAFHDKAVVVKGDEHQLKQAFINLIKNGIEAMPHGGTLRISTEIANGNCVQTTISDTGIGMSPELKAKLGQAFFTTKETGTGLGLLVTNRIIHHHHGTLQVDSELGVGTRMIVTLPITCKML